MDICKYYEDVLLQAYKTNIQKNFSCRLVNKMGFTTTVNFTTSTNGYWLKQCCKEGKESCKRYTTLNSPCWAASKEMPQMAQSPTCPTHLGPRRPSQNSQGRGQMEPATFSQPLKSSAGIWFLKADQDYCYPEKAEENLA